MSLSSSLAGRRKESAVWELFEYIESKRSSKCLVFDDKGKVCGFLMSGKNPSNLKKHIETRHPVSFEEISKKDSFRLSGKRKSPGDDHPSTTQTIGACFSRSIVTWDASSHEHKRREQALLRMFIETGCPSSMIDNKGFRTFCSTMDSKFQLPGKFGVNSV
jgi:hypothetical protein